jgi:hypothetical protein
MTEACNGVDDNCDGQADEGVKSTFYADADGDGFGTSGNTVLSCSAPFGYVINGADCNDTPGAGSINPAATEICNGIDDNCNSEIDEGVKSIYYADADGDGFGSSGNTVLSCSTPFGYVINSTDCNDIPGAESINPAATEICNGIDDNCNTQIDEGVKSTFYADVDGDGFGNSGNTATACSAPSGYIMDATDCNDTPGAGSINPAAAEICNGIDDNCNSQIDEGVKSTFYADADADGFGNSSKITMACSAPSGYVVNGTDCNDSPGAASINPNASEVCNGVDDNCNTQTDEGLKTTFYADADHDSYGSNNITTLACVTPLGYVSVGTDCNDANASVHPGVADVCNGIDDNCNNVTDENAITASILPVGTVNVCSGSQITLSANKGAGISYQWKKGNKNIGGATNATYSTGAASTYKVFESNGFGCSATSNTANVVEVNAPAATITPVGSLNICTTGNVILQAATGSGYSYQWRKAAIDIAGATNVTYTATKAATYTVVVSSNGCTKTSAGAKVIKSCRQGDVTLDDPIDVSLYPNPTDGKFIVEATIPEEFVVTEQAGSAVLIEVISITGDVVLYEKIPVTQNAFTHQFFLNPALPVGMYFVKIIVGRNTLYKRIIYQQ